MSTGRDAFRRHRHLISLFERATAPLPRPIVGALRYLPGVAGTLGRYLWAKRSFAAVGEACYLAAGCVFKNVEGLSVGDRFSVHEFCYIDAAGGIRIGNDVAVAHGCSILTTNHRWSDSNRPIKYNLVEPSAVEIADDVWIGCGVRILAGARIQSRVVVAAGAVVRGELESGFVYGGVPARKLRPL